MSEEDSWECKSCGQTFGPGVLGHACPKNQGPGIAPCHYCICPDGKPDHESSCPAMHGGVWRTQKQAKKYGGMFAGDYAPAAHLAIHDPALDVSP